MLHEGPNKKALFELSTKLNLKQIIEELTRITDNWNCLKMLFIQLSITTHLLKPSKLEVDKMHTSHLK